MVSDWILRLRSILKRRAVEQELDDELRFHFDRLVDRHLESGLTRDEAVRRARLEFGRFDHIKEEHRDARAIGFIDDLGRDLSYAFRQLRRSPGFALLAKTSLPKLVGGVEVLTKIAPPAWWQAERYGKGFADCPIAVDRSECMMATGSAVRNRCALRTTTRKCPACNRLSQTNSFSTRPRLSGI